MKTKLELVDTTSTETNRNAARCLTIDNAELEREHSISPRSGQRSLARGNGSGTKWSEAPLLRRLVERCNPNSRVNLTSSLSAILLIIPFVLVVGYLVEFIALLTKGHRIADAWAKTRVVEA